jgi:hypothetical protein
MLDVHEMILQVRAAGVRIIGAEGGAHAVALSVAVAAIGVEVEAEI